MTQSMLAVSFQITLDITEMIALLQVFSLDLLCVLVANIWLEWIQLCFDVSQGSEYQCFVQD